MQQIKRGFTLIETLVALAILTVALGASVTLTRTIYVQAQKSGDISQMNSLASESIANLRFMRNSAYKPAGTPDGALNRKFGTGETLGNGHFTVSGGKLSWEAKFGTSYDVAIKKTNDPITGCDGYVQNYEEDPSSYPCDISHDKWDIYRRQIIIDTVIDKPSLYTISVTMTNVNTGASVNQSAVVGDVDPNTDISNL